MKIENRIQKKLHVKATNPMLIGRIISKVLFELNTIKTESAITIKSLKRDVSQGVSNSHVIIFIVENPESYRKGKASQLTAIDLRLKLFCNHLIQATGYYFPEPSLFQYDSFMEVRLPVPDVLETTDDLFSGSVHGPSPVLSSREQEIVAMVRAGHDNNGISSNLGITHSTVKQHLKAIYRKMGVKNRVELIFS